MIGNRLDHLLPCWQSGFKFIVLLSIGLLTACSVKLNVEHVPQAMLANKIKEQGVFFTLPKTQLTVSSTVRLVETKSGKYVGYIKDGDGNKTVVFNPKAILKSCETETGGGKFQVVLLDDDKLIVMKTLYVAPPNVAAKTIPDTDQIYFLNADFDRFASFNHTLTMTDDGVISSAASRVDNKGVMLTKFGIDLLSRAAGVTDVAGTDSTRLDSETVTNCQTLKNLISPLDQDEADIEKLETAYDEKRKDLAEDILTNPQNYKNVNLELLKDALETQKSEYESALADFKKKENYKKLYGTSSQAHYKYSQVCEPKLETDTTTDGTFYKSEVNTNCSDETLMLTKIEGDDPTSSKSVNIAKISGCTATDFDELVKCVSDNFSLTLDDVALTNNLSASVPKSGQTSGYRYRIPVSVGGIITIASSKYLVDSLTIAQLGPLVELPDKIKGLAANIDPTFSDSGSLIKIVLGATPLSTEDVLGNIDAANTLRRGLRDAPPKSELDQLKDENALLEQRKKNRDLKKELGL